jgi:hypothetical protein
MRFKLFLVLLGINFSLNVYGQKVPHSIECEEQTSSILKSFNKQDFQASSILFRSLTSNCPEGEKKVLPNYVAFLKEQISGQKDIQVKTQLIDSLEKAYRRMEELQLYSTNDDIARVTYLLNSPNSNKETIHKLIKRHLNEPQVLSESLIVQFYANLSILAKEERNDKKTTSYTQQFFLIYPELTKLFNEQKYSEKSHSIIQSYYESTFGSCNKMDNSFQSILDHLPKNQDSINLLLTEISSTYEKMNCLASNTYKQVLDSLSRSGKTVELELKKANHYKEMRAYSSTNSYLETAKKLSNNPREIDSIQLEQCKNMVVIQEFKKAFDLCISPKTNYQGEFYIIAAQCVMAAPETCKESDLQFKLNAFLANELLVKAKTYSISIDQSLESKVKNALPNDQELKELGVKHGQEITLPCWNQTLKIP